MTGELRPASLPAELRNAARPAGEYLDRIVVKDGVGFYSSRILAPYMNEAAYLLSEGGPIETIDQALIDFWSDIFHRLHLL